MTTMEERVELLEEEVARLKAAISLIKPRERDWRRTVGMFADDPVFDEAEELGRQWREEQTYERELAGA